MAYDKEKAHEYYINYVKKGLKKGKSKKKTDEEQAASDRKSTKGLNDAGKAAAKQVKEQISAERKEALSQLQAEMQEKIKAIQERIKAIKGLDSNDLLAGGDTAESLKAEIEKLREDTKAAKEKVKADYDERYLQMLDEIKADKDYKQVKKATKKKKSTK